MTERPRRSAAERWLTPLDEDLLRALESEGSLAAACRAIGIGRYRGIYRLRRLAGFVGAPVVSARRGGVTPGESTLSPQGRALLRRGVGSVRGPGKARTSRAPPVYRGTWHAKPEPHVVLRDGLALTVGFRAHDGERVGVAVDPEAVLVAEHRHPTSARNVLRGTVVRSARLPGWQRRVSFRVGGIVIPVSVTPVAVRELGLRRGRRAWLYLKAASLRRA